MEPTDERKAACPTCGEEVDPAATECPKCGEAFAIEVAETHEDEEKGSKRLTYLFWAGLVLIILGGPGIAIGSLVHDVLKINFPAGYDSWETFGWVNRMTSAGGLILLLVGLALLVIAITKRRPEEYEEEN
jgi:hypothetical protein